MIERMINNQPNFRDTILFTQKNDKVAHKRHGGRGVFTMTKDTSTNQTRFLASNFARRGVAVEFYLKRSILVC